jgi:NAD-dependent SIR2 family protein deacetylase
VSERWHALIADSGLFHGFLFHLHPSIRLSLPFFRLRTLRLVPASTHTHRQDTQLHMSSSTTPQPQASSPLPATAGDLVPWHGVLGAPHRFPPATCAVASDALARPDYTAVRSSEFLDAPAVLDAKADLLIELLRQSKHTLMYTGAGISTSSGIRDYASQAPGSLVQQKKAALTRSFIDSLQPTPAHRILTALEQRGLVHYWLQQNHDGLAQKAGFPFAKLNEIHGSWHDTTNPVVKMSGNLRSDLFDAMCLWETKADLVVAIGTSLSGMNADRCATACAARAARGAALGTVIVSIQQTPQDAASTLRVFAKIDDFMQIVQRKMQLVLDTKTYPARQPAPAPVPAPAAARGSKPTPGGK